MKVFYENYGEFQEILTVILIDFPLDLGKKDIKKCARVRKEKKKSVSPMQLLIFAFTKIFIPLVKNSFT